MQTYNRIYSDYASILLHKKGVVDCLAPFQILREKLKQLDAKNYVAVARMVCDHFSEQTDISLPKIYKRLFDPDYRTFYDIV
ncbi:MAG: hypothetical protein DRP93_05640 [Candidatus Neomarinimicrobiota bacterium]|nr:MAG: hypothetical protein DRP93_05640 [Candidatus Neomarinimicrobiota bacterium]